MILAGVDDSVTSLRAAAYAAGLARRQAARFVVLYVRPPATMAALAPMGAASIQQALDETSAGLRRPASSKARRAWGSAQSSLRLTATRSLSWSGWPMSCALMPLSWALRRRLVIGSSGQSPCAWYGPDDGP